MTYTEFCTDVLPQGSGFNCAWEHVKTQKNGAEVFKTYHHNLNEHGYYDGFTSIRLTIPAILGNFRITLNGPARYTDYNTREYMAATIWHCLEGRAFNFKEV